MPVRIPLKKLNKTFVQRLEKVSGQNIHQCFQCGACSGSCPMAHHMDVLPRRILHLAQLGLEKQLENLKTCWICASCDACNVICPRGIDLPRVMEALRLITLRKNQNFIEPSELPVETLRECPRIALVAAFRKMTS